MKKTKRQCRVLTDPVYRTEVFFLLGGTADELKQYFIELHGWAPDFDETTAGLQHRVVVEEVQNNRFYIWLDKPEAGNLVHETGHLVFDILRMIGMVSDEKNEEAFCYLQEYYFREIWAAIQDMKKRKKK